MAKIKDILTYYQKKIDRHKHDDDIIIDSIHKISKLPVTAELLQETGVTNILNVLSLRTGRVGERAKPLFTKWRQIQKDKESPIVSPVEEKTPSNNSCSYSKSSAESNVSSHCSRDSARGAIAPPVHHPITNHFEVNAYDRRDNAVPPERNRCNNSDLNGVSHTDNFHQDDGVPFNPHLTIDNSEKIQPAEDDGSESKTSKIQEPYFIEMKEGMFKAVKTLKKSPISHAAFLVCQYITKDIMKGHMPFRLDKDGHNRNKFPDLFTIRGESSSASKPEVPSHREAPRSRPETVTNGPKEQRHHPHHTEKSGVRNSHVNNHAVESQTDKREKLLPHSNSAGVKRKPCPPAEEGRSSVKKKSISPNVNKEGLNMKRKSSSPSVAGPGEKRKASSPLVTGDRESAKKKLCLGNEKTLGREKDRRPPPVLDNRLKVKPIKEEKISPSHVPIPPSYPEMHPNVCDKKPIKKASPDSVSMQYISSKKERRAIYSGKRSVQEVLSLQKFCMRVLRKNLDYMKSTTIVETAESTKFYETVKPLLELLNPMQLYKVEEQNKHLVQHTNGLWKQHCCRDYRTEIPAKGELWRSVYYKAYQEQSKKLKNLTAAAASKTKPDRHSKLTLVDSPHDPLRRRSKANNSPVPPAKVNSPLVTTKSSPSLSTKTSSPNVATKSNSPVMSKSSHKEHKSPGTSHKTTKKADAPLMSKVKKTMGHMYSRTK